MSIEAKFITGKLPNFVFLDIGSPPGRRQDGFNPDSQPKISVGQLSKGQAEEYAEQWKSDFLAHHQKKHEQFLKDYT